jgi:rifampicin phosphotransferase
MSAHPASSTEPPASAPPRWVYFFTDTLPDGAEAKNLLGGKGASLADMSKAGLLVPPGFTITTEACRHFYEHGMTWPDGLEDQVREHLVRLEETTRRKFGQGKNPLFVSVRSGAAISMPGMMDTVLNCGIHPALAGDLGDTPQFWNVYIQFVQAFAKSVCGTAIVPDGRGASGDENIEHPTSNIQHRTPSRELAAQYHRAFRQQAGRDFPHDSWTLLVECINAVFRSWESERAIAYRKRNNIRGLTGTAVNVQAMFPSRVSGIVFTQDPNNLAAKRIVIESSYGLGEAIVSGDVTPDRFLVSRDDFSAVETFPGSKTSAVAALGDDVEHDPDRLTLTREQIAELCELSMRVEKYFDKPMDIEWGWADGKFSLLQSRGIRGLDIAQDAEVAREEEVLRLRELANGKHRVWVTHNLRETLRAPTPLTWDIVRNFMSGSGGFGLMYQDFGYQPSAEVCESGFLELICGRIYADPERVAQLFWGGLPLSYDLQQILADKSALDRAPTKFDAAKVDETFLFRLPGAVRALIRSSRNMKRLRRNAKAVFENEVLPPYLDYVREKRAEDLTAKPTAAVVRDVFDRCERVLNEFGKESLKPAFFGGLALGSLETLLGQLMGHDEGASCASMLTMGLENDSTYEQDSMLYRVARGEAWMPDFLEKYGHRATNEMELSEPRWREDQAYLRQIIAQIQRGAGRSLDDIHHDNVRKARHAHDELPSRLAECAGSSFREEIDQRLREARELLPYRETAKHYLMMGYELVRLALVELGRRWDLGDDVFFLHLKELEHFEERAVAFHRHIERRKIRWKSLQRLDVPDVIDSEHITHLGMPQEFADASELQGEAVSAGVATGRAQIVFNPREAGDIGLDYVLVCPSTDPGWTPLFINARALIVERGGVLSHGAIVARDFGIPAIVYPHATAQIKTGERIRVDGNSGKITKIPEA